VVGGFGWFVWLVSTQVALVPHPVATLGFPTFVYGAGSALCCVVALAGSCLSRLPVQPAGVPCLGMRDLPTFPCVSPHRATDERLLLACCVVSTEAGLV